jgi:hypothetical protein
MVDETVFEGSPNLVTYEAASPILEKFWNEQFTGENCGAQGIRR